MPPKKGKGKGKQKKEPVKEVEPEAQIQLSEASMNERELDLLDDLNDDFFSAADQVTELRLSNTEFNFNFHALPTDYTKAHGSESHL